MKVFFIKMKRRNAKKKYFLEIKRAHLKAEIENLFYNTFSNHA